MKDIEEDLGLSRQDTDYDEMLHVIEARVIDFMSRDPELLFSYLYRLDIKESDIQHALSIQNTEEPSHTLSKLILKRQIQRIETKKRYPQAPIKGWEF